ncbi:acylneuraminate cytidylyltransferase [Planctomonas sp. JC2975]|uniref:acylneuraminate cytidylyltransferase n=1 Tax=Planctomonas sp. JC2975 TaxID=2729626 RepID=UPI0014757B0E|nr:acylneuraminate cytidylyltransferase [Planctomonas sp. JC2975]NNC11822.1 acylneuraminate cytidylyltransferase [Planctomonas sp. JC2975]
MPSLERTVAVIPARAGSVGVPGKNLRDIGGVPLVARAVATALAAASVDRVVVSTDGLEIAAVATEAGADVIMRPAALSTGTASSESALTHALDVLAERGIEPATIVFLQATSPFTRPRDIDAAVERVRSGERDVVFAAVETHTFVWSLDGAGQARGVNHDPSYRPMRQDREPQYQETGAFYVLDAAGFRRTGYRFFGRVGVAVTPDAIDIDTEYDLRLADAVAHLADGDPSLLPGAESVPAQPAGVATRAAATVGSASGGAASAGGADPLVPDPMPASEIGSRDRLARPLWDPSSMAAELEAELGQGLSEGFSPGPDSDDDLALIEAVVTDFDGVHTDDRVQVDQNGVESVTVNRRDGLGVRMLREAGIPVLILSTETNPVVAARAAKLGVPVLQGVDDKAAALDDWAADAGIRLDRVAYLGNDVNDLGALRAVGWPFAVGDAHPRAIAASRRVLSSPGGAGAVRELAELILERKA